MIISAGWRDYEVLDTGDGEKLERWGEVVLRRPDPQVIWPQSNPSMWEKADAHYIRSQEGGGEWRVSRSLPESWRLQYRDLTFVVRPTGFKHTGLFPEQAANWDFMAEQIRSAGRPAKVLNLFAYTGGATLACAGAGAEVVHVDAAKGMVNWAKENLAACGLQDRTVRFIVDDVFKFVQREVRRGNVYDGIVMDPPSYGRGPDGQVWKLETAIFQLLTECVPLLAERPLFFILNAYTTGLQPAVLHNLLSMTVAKGRNGEVTADELCLPVSTGSLLPCGATARFFAKG